MIRRFGPPVQAGQSYRRRPGAYAILWDGQASLAKAELLVTHQGGDEDEFQLPGGGIDEGESPVQALHREVMEETGWAIATPRHFLSYRRFVFMPDYDIWAEKICHIFTARPVLRRGPPTEPDHSEVWMSPQDAGASLASSADRAAVRRCFRI
jgi:8-oxo-dGTP diphosphatase